MKNAIEIKNLTWQYSDTIKPAIENISLEIEENSFIGLCGPNEAGKTTLVSCIKGIIPSNFTGIFEGEIKIFGKNIKEMDTKELAEYVGFVFADPEAQFTSMSVEEELAFGMENVGFSREEIKERIEWVVDVTNIRDLLDKSPYDISGGQKQRVAIASILAMRPKILILDEPTSMLDPIGKDSIFDICRKMKEEFDITIIMVEHTIDRLARLSDKLILMNGGKIEKYAEPEEFFDDMELIKAAGLNAPSPMIFLDELRKRGLYKGNIKTNLEDVIEITKSLLSSNYY